ncbi:hypothetical protein [Haladaptatus sp. NG-WS-4]
MDGLELLRHIGIDREEIRWRKDYTGFDRTDAERLSEMSGLFAEISEELVGSSTLTSSNATRRSPSSTNLRGRYRN